MNEQLTALLWISSRVVIVLALIIVGIRLSLMKRANISRLTIQIKYLKNALIIKLVGLPDIMLIISAAIRLPNVMREALVLQSVAPIPRSTLLISKANSTYEEEENSLVVLSTIISLISILAWLMILRL
tara:strand:- start:962 stop:1348 length:387 start_codon:yes stop_codon:yes gene_type:complete